MSSTPSLSLARPQRLGALLLLLLATLALAACGNNRAEASAGGASAGSALRVVTTTGQIADIAQNIGGDAVQVEALMGAGVDPHLFVASESDVERLAEADIIFYNGHFLEAQMDDVLKQIGEYKPVIPVTEAIDPVRLIPWALDATEFDPHIWFDVKLWQIAAEAVRDGLVELDPARADAYRANADQYLAQLAELDAYVQEQANSLPSARRILVTAHDAFSYFGRAYGFTVRGLQGISTASEAGTSDVRDLAIYIAQNHVPAIFVESSVPVRTIEALQAAVEAQGWQVEIGGSLFSDAMGSPGTPEGTYNGMVRHNIDTIVAALKQ
jgi:manganese/zinc/iron transport system substrate-binding protein